MAARGKASDKHGRASRSNSKANSGVHWKTDTSHLQRKGGDEAGAESEDETNWYEEGESEFTSQAIRELDAKVTMQAVVSTPPMRGGHHPPSAAVRKKPKKKRKDSPQGRSLPARDAQTKYLGKKWGTVPVAYKRGSLAGRKGDITSEIQSPYGLYAGDDSVYSLSTEASTSEVQGDRKIQFPCKFYSMQRCKKGAACPFLHSDVPVAAGSGGGGNGAGYGGSHDASPPSGVCLDWYYYGSCANGDSCGLAHWDDYFEEEEEEEVQRVVCPLWLQGRCKAGGNCRNQHMETTKADVSAELSKVLQGAGRIANTVAERIQKLRGTVLSLKDSLQPNEQFYLTRTLQMVLGRLDAADREMLLGLQKDIVGLTRFRSVLIKRMLKWAYDSLNLDAIEELSQWEASLCDFFQPPPPGDGFSKFFEQHLCNRYVEVIRCQLASPYTRIRGEWVDQAIQHSTSPDLLHDVLSQWLPYQATHEMCWKVSEHSHCPLPHRRRVRGFARAMNRMGRSWALKNPLIESIAGYLPLLCESDIPKAHQEVGAHPSLDMLLAILVDYEVNVLNEAEGARNRMGETIWPLVSAEIEAEVAPKITGMLLQLEPTQLLLVAVNTDRFSSALSEAMEVLQER